MKRFRIKLKDIHEKTGLSAYAVAKEIGIATNTVQKYISEDEIIAEKIPMTVILMANFYGVGWSDIQEVVEVIDANGESSPESKTPQAARLVNAG